VTRVPRRPAQRSQRVSAELHRPEQFPTPSPLTEQEKLLVQYVEATSKSALPAEQIQVGRGEGLSIPGVNIAALEPIKPVSEFDEKPNN